MTRGVRSPQPLTHCVTLSGPHVCSGPWASGDGSGDDRIRLREHGGSTDDRGDAKGQKTGLPVVPAWFLSDTLRFHPPPFLSCACSVAVPFQ